MKKLMAMMMALMLCVGLLAGCGGSSGGGGTGGGDAGGSETKEVVDATVTVWGPQEDQSDDNGKWLQTQCEAFAAAHPEWNITFKYRRRKDKYRYRPKRRRRCIYVRK